MLKTGILNPRVLDLLARIRHTNQLVIADRGFPFWPMIETVDLSLVNDIPTVLQVCEAVRENFVIGKAFMAEEFLTHNPESVHAQFSRVLSGIPREFESHEAAFKKRIPSSVGLIRTGDTIPYANLVLVSA